MQTYLADIWHRWRTSKLVVVVIVFIAFAMDFMLFTCVVPIIPDYLYRIEHPDQQQMLDSCELTTISAKNLFIHDAIKNKRVQRLALDRLIGRNETPTCSLLRNETLQLAEQQRTNYHDDLLQESGRVGVLLGSKAFVQLIANPIVGVIIPRYGSTRPMFFGFLVMTISILMFAYANTYGLLLVARALQGLSSSFSSISSACLLADRFPDDRERGVAFGRATAGIAFGSAFGSVFGGVLYNYFGKTVPFLILAGVAVFDGLLRLSIVSTEFTPNAKPSSLINVVRDPLMLTTVGACMIITFGVAILQATLPIHMMLTMTTSSPLYQGLAFLPVTIAVFIGQNTFGAVAFHVGRWLFAIGGLCIGALYFVVIPWVSNLPVLFAVQLILGIAQSMVMSSMVPTLLTLIDLRHSSLDYANALALFDAGFALTFMIGPVVGGYMLQLVGFTWMLTFVGVVNLLYAPLLYYLRSPQPNSEQIALIETAHK